MTRPTGKPLDAKYVRLELSAEDHERLRQAAHDAKVAMSTLARSIVSDWLDDREVWIRQTNHKKEEQR